MEEEDPRGALEAALRRLVGLPLTDAFRVAGVDVFWLGRPGETADQGSWLGAPDRYSLHVQCGWGIVRSAGVVVGRLDYYFLGPGDAPDPPGTVPRRGVRLRDAYLAEDPGRQRRVAAVRLERGRDLDVALDDGSVLEVRPLRWVDDEEDLVSAEYWRLLGPEGRQLVVGNAIRIPKDSP